MTIIQDLEATQNILLKEEIARLRADVERLRNPSDEALGALVVWASLDGNRLAVLEDARIIWGDVVSVALAATDPESGDKADQA